MKKARHDGRRKRGAVPRAIRPDAGRSSTSRRAREATHQTSPTAVAAEAQRLGGRVMVPTTRRAPQPIPGEGETIRVGDPDDLALLNEYVGEETPGGNNPSPDQNNVDDIGRAYGLQEEDAGALRSGAEILSRRDRHRSELKAPGRPPG